jgi:hypothetical protein
MKLIITTTLLFTALFANAQTNSLRLNPNIVLPKDSIESTNLISSLNNFLLAAHKPNEENKFVFESEKIETFILLDEVNGIEKSEKFKDDYFYKPYLTNIVLLKDNNYLLQVSYIGIAENTAFLKANFVFIAHKTNNTFTFSSPLLENTKKWKFEKIGNVSYFYEKDIDRKKMQEFNKLYTALDLKLKPSKNTRTYYVCSNDLEILKLIGIEYKADYNGGLELGWVSSTYKNKYLVLIDKNNSTYNDFGLHDLFHHRLDDITNRDSLNNPVDEGCAYIYGGSWGYSWKEIFKAFKEQIASNKNTNWKEIKENPISFKTGVFSNSADFIVNALLVKKIEKEKGFAGVWELLNIGPFEKGNEKYYKILEKLTGITKANYNDKIWELINNEK